MSTRLYLYAKKIAIVNLTNSTRPKFLHFKSGKTTNILHTVCEDNTTESCDTEDEEAETKANPKGVWVNNIGLARFWGAA